MISKKRMKVSWYEECYDCRNHTFRIEFTREGEVACHTDWYCIKCGTHVGGFLNDPLNEVKDSQFNKKGE